MAARNRPRGAFAKDDSADAHEERNMWSQIVTDIKRLRTTHARAAEVGKLQVELEIKLASCKSLCGMISLHTVHNSAMASLLFIRLILPRTLYWIRI